MRFQVPQFVDIEDKIIGPLTLKMFAYYAVAGMLLVPLYVSLDISLFITLGLPIVGVAALFAHVRIQGQQLIWVLVHATTFYVNPRVYLWRRGGLAYLMKIQGPEYEEIAAERENASSLNAIAQMLNTQGNVSLNDAADPLLAEAGPDETVTATAAPAPAKKDTAADLGKRK
ncbi:MAG: PrgI family protein [Candidatus Andersenbacteria bacterium]|nr:PrgI family protein [Candidatus Andersenbacteria bacterium]